MSGPILKRGHFDCDALRQWAKRQHCYGPGCDHFADDPHHHPTRGAGGDDLGIVPLCRGHHDEAHAGRLSREWQARAAGTALVSFLRCANAAERAEFISSWEKYASARVFTEVAS